jgi:hypothetical protein
MSEDGSYLFSIMINLLIIVNCSNKENNSKEKQFFCFLKNFNFQI